jgi:hypothetical protein
MWTDKHDLPTFIASWLKNLRQLKVFERCQPNLYCNRHHESGEQKTIGNCYEFQKYTLIKLKNKWQITQLFDATDTTAWKTKLTKEALYFLSQIYSFCHRRSRSSYNLSFYISQFQSANYSTTYLQLQHDVPSTTAHTYYPQQCVSLPFSWYSFEIWTTTLCKILRNFRYTRIPAEGLVKSVCPSGCTRVTTWQY